MIQVAGAQSLSDRGLKGQLHPSLGGALRGPRCGVRNTLFVGPRNIDTPQIRKDLVPELTLGEIQLSNLGSVFNPEPTSPTSVEARPGLLLRGRVSPRRHGRPCRCERITESKLRRRGVAGAIAPGLIDEISKDKGQLGRVRGEEVVGQFRTGEFHARLPQPRTARGVVEAVRVRGRAGGHGGAEGFVAAAGVTGLGHDMSDGRDNGFGCGQVGGLE